MFLLPGLVIGAYVTGVDLGDARKRAIRTYIRNHQHLGGAGGAGGDGGWGIHIEGPSTMFGTVMQYVALRLLGAAADDPACALGRGFIRAHGGAVETSSWAKFYLCVLGVYDWRGINSIPCEAWLLP